MRVVLGPFKMKNISKPVYGEGNFFISKSEFSEVLEESKVAYALVLKDVGDENPNIPEMLVPLLDRFQEIIPDEIPAGLLPMRDMQHCIDFVPGAVLLNKAAY